MYGWLRVVSEVLEDAARALRIWRAEEGVSQRDLAKSLGISLAKVSRIERAQMRPSPRLQAKIAMVTGGALGIIDWLEDEQVSSITEELVELGVVRPRK